MSSHLFTDENGEQASGQMGHVWKRGQSGSTDGGPGVGGSRSWRRDFQRFVSQSPSQLSLPPLCRPCGFSEEHGNGSEARGSRDPTARAAVK